jgi:hypothetical protein
LEIEVGFDYYPGAPIARFGGKADSHDGVAVAFAAVVSGKMSLGEGFGRAAELDIGQFVEDNKTNRSRSHFWSGGGSAHFAGRESGLFGV